MSNNTKQTVIHVVSSLKVGGAERFVIDLCQEQRQLGMDVAILSFGSPEDALVKVCRELKVRFVILSGKSLQAQWKRYQLLSKFDVIHIHSPAVLKSLIFHVILLKDKTLIYTRHGAAPLRETHWVWLHRLARRYIHAVTFVSADAQRIFCHHDWHNVSQYIIDNGVKLPTGIITSEHSAMAANKDVLRLGSVGRMVKLKSQLSLLHAVSQLDAESQRKIELHFFGDGELRSQLEAFHQQHNGIKAIFHGMQTNRENIYPDIDVLVVTSSTEGLSMVILEAMAYGKAVIATNVGGNPVLVKHEQTGWLYEYDDINQLKKLILNVLNAPEYTLQCGVNARQWVAEHYALSHTAQRYQALYSAK